MWYVFVNHRGHAKLCHFETEHGLHDWLNGLGYTKQISSKVWTDPRELPGKPGYTQITLLAGYSVWSNAMALADQINKFSLEG